MIKAYEVLGVTANADEAAIRAAFRKAAKECHPDLHGGDPTGVRRLRRLMAARDFLINRGRHLFPTRLRSRQVLQLRPPSNKRRVGIACALAGVTGLLLLLFAAHGSETAPAPVGTFETVTVSWGDPEIPDAGSAEIKAIRDLREGLDASQPAHQSASSPAGTRRKQKARANRLENAVTKAASELSRTWRHFALKLRGA